MAGATGGNTRSAKEPGSFDPRKYLRTLRGKGKDSEYLDVKWRLLWLRTEHPDAVIDTAIISHDPGVSAVVRSNVSIPGGGSASGYGSETAKDFEAYLEKAETKATGRALVALGYGTEFASQVEIPESSEEPDAMSEKDYASLFVVMDTLWEAEIELDVIRSIANLVRPSLDQTQRDGVREWIESHKAIDGEGS